MKRVWSGLFIFILAGVVTWAIPSAPANLTGQVSGTTVTLTWSAPPGAILGYQIEAGSGPGLTNITTVPVGPGLSLTAPNVPPGTYYLRVRALDASGLGPPSNEVVVVVGGGVGGGCTTPAAPTGLTASASGSTASVSWQSVGGAGITYVLDVGSGPGLTNVGIFPVGAALSLTATAPNGTFYLRVRAINACGTTSPASAEVTLVVGPGGGGAPPPTASDWLSHVNAWRSRAGLAAVTENPAYSAGAALHARYTVKHGVLMHDEDPSSPWYTPEGKAAAAASNGAGHSSVNAPDSFAIESWVVGPFHALGVFDPRLRTTGFGSYREATGGSIQMSGWLDVIRGLGPGPMPALPILFPANGVTIPIPDAAFCPPGTACHHAGESPNPLTSCPGYTFPAGLPLYLLFTPFTSPTVTASSLSRGGVALEHCVFTGSTYTNPDPGSQATGRSVLNGRGGVVLIPRSPLPAGAMYTASVTANGQTYQWSFTIAAALEAPTPDWARGIAITGGPKMTHRAWDGVVILPTRP